MHCLIPTEPDDTHAILVKLALENMDHQATLLFTADQPTLQKNSIFIDLHSYHWKSTNAQDAISENNYDILWWRRARKPWLPKECVHPEDYVFIVRENMLFYESFTYNLSPNAWWVNTKEAANRANFKLLQLKLASESGMLIPTTLCSNDPNEINDFIRKYEKHGVICKPLCSNFWFEQHTIKAAYTAKITSTDLPQPHILQLAPGIYQQEIKKKYELRVTCFGNYLVAVKIDSQSHASGQTDWRAIPMDQLYPEPYKLPDMLATQIRYFMQKIGIVFGAFDFIVTHDDQYVFLEVNEQGQFLWLEDTNPELKMLDIFVQFLLNKSINFHWKPNFTNHSIADYQCEINALFAHNMQNHVAVNIK